jgi:hypothetical protein
VRLRYGPPRLVPRGLDAAAMETLRRQVQAELAAFTAGVDRECGAAPIPPAADA